MSTDHNFCRERRSEEENRTDVLLHARPKLWRWFVVIYFWNTLVMSTRSLNMKTLTY